LNSPKVPSSRVVTTRKVTKVVRSAFSEEQKKVIGKLKAEMAELLAAEREYYDLEEEFLCLEAELKREQQDLERYHADFSARHTSDQSLIDYLKREIEDQKMMLADKQSQNGELKSEFTQV
jgi:hypothetical protein